MPCRRIWLVAAALFAAVGCVVAARAEDGDDACRRPSSSPALSEKEAFAELKQITDEELAELLKLKKLRHLDVRGTRVTGAGATPLPRFLPELELASGALASESATPATGSPLPNSTPKNPAIFPVTKINELCEKAAALSQPVEDWRSKPSTATPTPIGPGSTVPKSSKRRSPKGPKDTRSDRPEKT